MAFEGRFWLLWEDQPIDVDSGRLVELRTGEVFDGRTGERRGSYAQTAAGIDILFDDNHGEQDVAQLRMVKGLEKRNGSFVSVEVPFDPNAGGYSVTWSTARYEAYVAARPLVENEPDEIRWDREQAEATLFGIARTYGAALRDGPEIYEMHKVNVRSVEQATEEG
jgi:hypothetical protein